MSETQSNLTELSDADLAFITGGTAPTPMPSFDIEQILSIGSQSTGAGAGRVAFNPFSITHK